MRRHVGVIQITTTSHSTDYNRSVVGSFKRASLVFALFSMVSCSEKPQGILLVIQSNDLPFETLQIGIGPEMSGVTFLDDARDAESGRTRLHVHDILGDGEFSTGSNDLTREPFRYFIRAEPQSKINISIVGWSNGNIAGLAALENVRVESGVVREYQVVLAAATTGVVSNTGANCVRGFDEERGHDLVLTYGTDYDCDQFQVEDGDCDPYDAFVNPGVMFDDCQDGPGPPRDSNCNGLCDEDAGDGLDGISDCGTLIDSPICELACNEPNAPPMPRIGEVCDGFDSDCRPDTVLHADRTLCAIGSPQDGCLFGSMGCDDGALGPLGDCQPLEDAEAPRDLCSKFDICQEPGLETQFECMARESGAELVHCVLPFANEQGLCAGDQVALEVRGGADCELDIIDPRTREGLPPLVAPLLKDGNTAVCGEGNLSFEERDDNGALDSFEFVLRKREGDVVVGMVYVIADLQLVESCSPTLKPLCGPDVVFF